MSKFFSVPFSAQPKCAAVELQPALIASIPGNDVTARNMGAGRSPARNIVEGRVSGAKLEQW
jgi:hypothetical protein